jgi:hypothetical protein
MRVRAVRLGVVGDLLDHRRTRRKLDAEAIADLLDTTDGPGRQRGDLRDALVGAEPDAQDDVGHALRGRRLPEPARGDRTERDRGRDQLAKRARVLRGDRVGELGPEPAVRS